MNIIRDLFEQIEKIKNLYEDGLVTESKCLLKITTTTEVALQKLTNKYEAQAFQAEEHLKKL